MTATANTTSSSRNATVTVSGSGLTGTVSVTQNGATPNSLGDVKSSEIKVYPNPAKNELIIENENLNKENETVQIIDFSGRIIIISQFEPSNSQLTIDVSHLQSGIYLLKIGNYRSKFIKE